MAEKRRHSVYGVRNSSGGVGNCLYALYGYMPLGVVPFLTLQVCRGVSTFQFSLV